MHLIVHSSQHKRISVF